MRRLTFFEAIIVLLLLFVDPTYTLAQKLPGDSAKLLPVLDNEISTYWPDLKSRSWLASIPDQESNWKTRATLRTSRELGCGLAQFTVAYDANGKPRFDALEETKRLDPSLRDWDWHDCYNVQYQLRGLVLKMKVNNRNCTTAMDGTRNILACNAATYNGGFGSVTKRIRLCRMDANCDPNEWFDNLERKCAQSTTKVAGYGESFCDINAKYPGRVEARQYKFLPIWPGEKLLSDSKEKK